MAKLYIISPPKIDLGNFLPKLDECLQKHKPKYFQLRLKDISDEQILFAARSTIPICRKYKVPFLLNDSAKLALECGADGVHIGDEDDGVAEARELLGKKAIIGASCYNSLELAQKAVDEGANYVSFGAFYPTKTKVAKSRAELETLQKWKVMSKVPCSAIGGITFENAKPIKAAGADYICMISAIWDELL